MTGRPPTHGGRSLPQKRAKRRTAAAVVALLVLITLGVGASLGLAVRAFTAAAGWGG